MALPSSSPLGQPVVVGFDGSEQSHKAVAWALEQARLLHTSLRVLYVWHIPPGVYGMGALYVPQAGIQAPDAELIGREVEAITAASPEVQAEVEVLEGRAGEELVTASKAASLLVVGNSGHGSFSGMLLGSVGLHCVTHADCPVVVVRGAEG